MSSDSSSSAPRGDTNIANIGSGAHVDQFAQGNHITQIKGATLEEVRVHLAQMYATYQPKPFDGRSPYVGLASFQEQDADRFFGREKLTQELVARIETARFLVIAGPSGSGKSSVARAGLLHELREGALDGSENWLYEILTPGRHPLEQLARVVSSFAKSTNAGGEIQKRGRDDATLLHRWADIALGDQRARRAILLVDQFEESFTQADADERAAFFNLLLYATTIENGRVTIVACTRSDFIGNWAVYPNLNAQLRHGVNQIPPMQDDELVSAIARPALQVGLQIDPELVKQILDDMRDAPGALPLMQFALQDLFEYEKSKGGVIALTRDDYLERGGLQKALARHADAEFAKLNAGEQNLARSVFSGLIEPGRGTVDTKRTALFEELVPAGSSADDTQKVIAKLADARLVTTDEVNQHETVMLAHERLIDAWGWLRKLVDENREAIALKNQIGQDAQEWAQSGRDASYLYSGARLATAQEQVAQKKITLSELAQAYVDASIEAREQARKKEENRTRKLIFAFSAAATIVAVIVVVAFLFQQQAEARRIEADHQQKIARSRELAALAENLFNKNAYDARRELAMLVAIEANKELDAITAESENALREFVYKFPLRRVLRGHENSVRLARFSPDGAKIVTASDDQTARVWDAESGVELTTLSGHQGAVVDAQYSPNGEYILTASTDGTARLWEAETGKPIAILHGHKPWSSQYAPIIDPLNLIGGVDCYQSCAQFSPDGSKIVTIGCDTVEASACVTLTAQLWDVAALPSPVNTKPLAVMAEDSGDIVNAQFSPDSNQLVTLGCHELENGICFTDTVQVWDVANGKSLSVLHTQNENIISAYFIPNLSPGGIQVLAGNSDGKVRLLDALNGKEIVILQEVVNAVIMTAVSPDGKQLVTVSAGVEGATPRLWDLETGSPTYTLRGHLSTVTGVQFSSNSKLVVTASFDEGAARVWDTTTGYELALLDGDGNKLTSAQFSPDGNEIVTAGLDMNARVWYARGGQEVSVLRGHPFAVTSAQFSPDGSKIITTSGDEQSPTDYEGGTAGLWDAATGKQLVIFRGHPIGTTSAQFSNDGKWLVTVGCDKVENNACSLGTARLWDVAASVSEGTGKQLAVLQGDEKRVWSAQFSRDGKWIVTIGCNKVAKVYCITGTVRLWNAETGKEIAELGAHEHVNSAQFSPDDKKIIAAGCEQFDTNNCVAGGAWVWDVSNVSTGTANEILTLGGHKSLTLSAQFSPDGTRIVTGGLDGTARLWEVSALLPSGSGKEFALLNASKQGAVRAQFSRDGKQILTVNSGVDDRTVRVWNASDGKPLAVISKLGSRIANAHFSPDGSEIVTVNDNNTAYLWDSGTGKEISALFGHGVSIYDAEFSSDGKKIVTASWDKTARVHLMDIQDLIKVAKTRIGRELTCKDREDYLNEENVCPTSTPEPSPTP